MKKVLKRVFVAFSAVSILTISAVCVAPVNHVDAASHSDVWQCRVCGQRSYTHHGTLPAEVGCHGHLDEYHVWERID